MTIVQRCQDDIIVKQNDVTDGLYLIQQGTIAMSYPFKTDQLLQSGDCFGHECLIHDQFLSRCDFKALTPVIFYFIKKSHFQV